MGAYTASKAALEGFADALAQEVAAFGIKVTVVQSGPFSTDLGVSAVLAEPLSAYDDVREAVDADNPRCGSSPAHSPTRSSRRSMPSGSRPGRSGPSAPEGGPGT